jgi:hypothetical protein
MNKIDLRKELKHLYAPTAKQVTVVDVPAFNFVMIDGRIKAGEKPQASAGFQEAMTALYGVSYTLKFTSKLRKVKPIDYTVMALEGLWWTPSGEFDFSKKEDWLYTVMMLQPDHITRSMFLEAIEQVKKKRDSAALSQLKFERFHEGLSMQIMHIGPYAEEAATIEKMHAFAAENGYTLRGKHHEIYLGDPRRTKPERLKTVLRHPVRKKR